MLMSPKWRTRLVAIAATIIAVWIGSAIAGAEFTWPAVFAGALGLVILVAIQPLPFDTLLLGAVCFGYIVGNRGFAQISVTGSIPLLPAEFVLVCATAILVVRCTKDRSLPIHRDLLNIAIVVWVAVSSVRLYADVREFGFVALRDYATVYYAAFFFLAQHAGEAQKNRRFIETSILIGSALLGVIYPLFLRYPDVFFGPLSFRGTPVIYFKGDLAGTFLAIASLLFFVRFELRRSWIALGASMLFAGGTLMTNNRASMLGLVAATVLLALGRRWRFLAVQVVGGITVAIGILFVAYVRNESWHHTPVYGVYERAVSVVDPFGHRTYSAEDAANKGDNNRFRMIWWRTVFDETMANGPITGLGYGYDLADRFVQQYYPDAEEEFTTRSPHNILLTTFARTGLVGLVPLLAIIGLMVVRTVRAARQDLANAGLWLSACSIFVSACLGVVLEGPMGAVVFWTILGIANAGRKKPTGDPVATSTASTISSTSASTTLTVS
jgi:O-antigen ligase